MDRVVTVQDGQQVSDEGEGDKAKYQRQTQANECSICLCKFEETEYVIRLSCNAAHIFHEECLTGWATSNYTCPLCREPIL